MPPVNRRLPLSCPRALGYARVLLGAIFLVRTTPLVNLLPFPLARVRGLLYGWPEPSVWTMAWADCVLPDSVRMLACVLRTAAATLFLVGVRARAAGIVAGALGIVAMSQDPFGFIFTLYTLFVATMVVATTDATGHAALRPESRIDPRSSVTLLCMFVATVYLFSGLAKANAVWLRGEVLLAYAEDGLFTTKAAAFLRAHDTLRTAAAWIAMASELSLPAALLVPRLRRSGAVAAVIMHATFECVARPDVMGVVMTVLLFACACAPAADQPSTAASRMPVSGTPVSGTPTPVSSPPESSGTDGASSCASASPSPPAASSAASRGVPVT